jgi:hypothetical protein
MELGFPCVWLLGARFFASPPFRGQGQWSVYRPPAVSVLWWFAVCFSILQCCLTLDVAHWLRRWTLWTATCPISGSGLSPACCWPFCLSSLCLLKFTWRLAPCPSPFSSALSEFLPPLLCASFQLVVYSVFCFCFFLWGEGRKGWELCWFIPGWLREYHVTLGAHLFGLPNVSQAGLQPESGGGGSPLVFSV